jgi:hypothetical protein
MSRMAGHTTDPAPAQPQRYLSPQEFSRVTGLSLATVHRYLRSGKVRHLQPAGPRGRILIPIDALENPTGAPPGPAPKPAATSAASTANSSPPAAPSQLPGPRPVWTRHGGVSPNKEN